jgi:hypothetical protein
VLLDPYRELGVDVDASRAQIIAAYRAAAKRLHPDARPGDAEAEERFKRVSTAYRVLADPVARARFDAQWRAEAVAAARGAGAQGAAPAPVVVPEAKTAPPPASERRSWLDPRHAGRFFAIGITCVLLGIAAAVWVVSLDRHDAALAARGVATRATVVEVGGARKLRFTTADGRVVTSAEPVKTGEGGAPVGAVVGVHYDRSDPTSIVEDTDHIGRDVTLWIVAAKLTIGGAILAGYAVRLRRRAAKQSP